MTYSWCWFSFRIGLPEECAGAVSFLASDDAAYITGETMVIGGGMEARLWCHVVIVTNKPQVLEMNTMHAMQGIHACKLQLPQVIELSKLKVHVLK